MCLRMVREFAGQPERRAASWSRASATTRCTTTSTCAVYAEIEETGLPLAFHAGPTWEDDWMKTMNRFISMHAISFVHCNIVHMTNWLMNGLPERFPKLKVIWVESGLAWVPVPDAAPRPRVPEAHLRGAAAQAPAERVHARDVLHVAADGDGRPRPARVDVRRDQRRDPAGVRVGLAALGLRPAEHLPATCRSSTSRPSATSSASTPPGCSTSTCPRCRAPLLSRGTPCPRRGTTRSSSAPASPASTPCTGCAGWGCRCASSRAAAASAARGTGTATRARAATSRASTTRYSFSRELLSRSGSGPSATPTQPEILRYLEHVADRFDLRRDIQLEHDA